MSEGTQRIVEEIREKLRRLSRRITFADLAYGALVAAGCVAGMLLAATLVEAIFWLPSSIRWVILATVVLSCLAVVGWFVARPTLVLAGWTKGVEETEVARRVGSAFPSVSDRLLNFLHLVSGRSSASTTALLDGAIAQLGLQLREPDYQSVERFGRAREVSRFATIPVIGLLVFVLLDPSGFSGAAQRLMEPAVFFAKPAPFQLIVDPGDAQIVKGDSLEMFIRSEGREEPSSIQLEIRRNDETRARSVVLRQMDDGSYLHTERNIRSGFSYRAVAGDIVSRSFEVSVTSRPFVRNFSVTVHPPAYTRLAPHSLAQNVGDFAAYPGSRVEVGVEASKTISSASIEFDQADPVNLSLDRGQATGSFDVVGDDIYRVHLVDDTGLGNDEPISYRIQRLVDEYPGISVLYPAPDATLTDELNVAVGGRLSDDFGFSSLKLYYRLSESAFGDPQDEYQAIDLPLGDRRSLDQDFDHVWDLSAIPGLDLVPGDVLEFYLEVRDNDQVAGFKRTSSPIQTLRFPSLAEQFDQLDDRQDRVEDDLESLLQDSREVQESFEQLRDELRRNQDGDWDDERQLERLREQQRQLEQRADELSGQVDDMVQQMQQNDLVSPETMQQFQEMKRVFEEINSPELNEALERLRQAMEELDLSEMQQSIGQVEFNEEQFLERLERALELFKRLRTEQKLEEAAKRAEDLAKRQEQIEQKTEDLAGEAEEPRDPTQTDERNGQEESDESQADSDQQAESPTDDQDGEERHTPETGQRPEDNAEDLAQEQERSSQDMEALEELLEQIREQMEEIQQAPTDELEELMDRAKQQDLSNQMKQNAQQLRQNKLNEAQQGQQQMQQSLQQMSQDLQQMQESMSGEQMQRNLAALRRALDDVLTLSLEQEGLRDEVRQVALRDAGLRRFTQQQVELAEGLNTVGDSLVTLSREIPQMSREIQTHAGQASMDMTRAVDEMVERRGSQAVSYQKGAMTNLNELALLLSELMQSMQNQQSGMGGMGMQQMLQQLQQMAGDQAKLNQQIQEMLNDMQGSRLTQDMEQRLQQMSAQQEALRRQLEQMGENAPSAADRLLGDLEQIAKQMEESINEMQQRNLDSRTVRRQQEILTRLLNAQKSIRERGKENRREGRTGNEFERASPSELLPDERAEQLRRELLDALETGYSPDFEELIRRYFELLQEQQEGEGE